MAARRAEQVRARLDQLDSKTMELRAAAEAGNADAWYQLSDQLSRQGRHEEAERAMQQAVDAGSWQAMWSKGNVAFSGGDHDAAERWYRRAAADRRYPLPVLYLARFLASRGGTDEAIELLGWLNDHSDIGVMGELAAVHRQRGEPEQAEQWLRRGAEAGEEDCRIQLGALLADRGESTEAERWYRAVVEAEDSNPDAGMGLAALLERRGELDEATRLYHQAADAGDPDALIALGRQAEQRGDFDEAEGLYEQAADEQPQAMLLLARVAGIARTDHRSSRLVPAGRRRRGNRRTASGIAAPHQPPGSSSTMLATVRRLADCQPDGVLDCPAPQANSSQ